MFSSVKKIKKLYQKRSCLLPKTLRICKANSLQNGGLDTSLIYRSSLSFVFYMKSWELHVPQVFMRINTNFPTPLKYLVSEHSL